MTKKNSIYSIIESLVNMQCDPGLQDAGIIPWATPIVSFGDISSSKIATLGLNPSNKEFVDDIGNEITGEKRRFQSLNSLGISSWSDLNRNHVEQIWKYCSRYFFQNPYDLWFKKLDYLLSGFEASYYFPYNNACHLDLIPFATYLKWGELDGKKRNYLLKMSADTLGKIINASSIEVLILNGQTVIENLQKLSNASFNKFTVSEWTLPRKNGDGVAGIAYVGHVNYIGEIEIKKNIRILGYNHNLQSSYGVTAKVQDSIKNWIGYELKQT